MNLSRKLPLAIAMALLFTLAAGFFGLWSAHRSLGVFHGDVQRHMAAERLAAEVEDFRRAVLATKGQGANVLADVADMRRRLAEAKPGQGGWDAKFGPGRLMDIELLAQMLALDEPHCFMTRASGQSMTGRGIDHGDLIVVNRALQAQHHDIVVAVLDNEITLKTLHQRDGVVKLLPAHPDYPDIVPAEGQTLTVWGVVTACVKVYARKP